MEGFLNELFDKHSEGYGVYNREQIIKEFTEKYPSLQLLQSRVVGQSEQLAVCKKCGSLNMYQYTKTKDQCEDCKNIQDY